MGFYADEKINDEKINEAGINADHLYYFSLKT